MQKILGDAGKSASAREQLRYLGQNNAVYAKFMLFMLLYATCQPQSLRNY